MASVSQHSSSWSLPRTKSDVDSLARRLTVSRARLARVIGVHPSALSRDRLSSNTQSAFGPMLKILNRITPLSGQERRAVTWFNHIPIIPMGDLPAIEHVANGDADCVLAFIDSAEDGAYS
jgi:hypothetical protein